jgi:KDO2-lipid IV(A) lauroyltransferase
MPAEPEPPITLRDRVEDVASRTLSGLIRGLPVGLLQRGASGIARVASLVRQPHAAIARVNLELVWPELDRRRRRQIERESIAHLLWNLIDRVRSEGWNADDLAAHVDFVGMENAEQALAAGNGAILLTPHLGNFELAVQRVALSGLKLQAPERPLRNPLVHRRVRAFRERYGTEVVDRDRAAPRMLRALRQKRPVAVLNDLYAGRTQGILVPFFGLRVSTSPGVAVLAVRTGAPICPSYVVRDAPDHHTVYILPALDIPTSGDRAQDVERITLACNAAYEDIVRRHPEQWLWMQRRFKHSPDLARDPYGSRRSTLRSLRRRIFARSLIRQAYEDTAREEQEREQRRRERAAEIERDRAAALEEPRA